MSAHHILGLEKTEPSLSDGNVGVINEFKTVEAFMRQGFALQQVPGILNAMKVGTVGKSLTLVERAYIAGFLDGDGAIMATIERHQEKRFGFRVRVTVKITQYHKKDVAWLVRTVGIGSLRKNRQTYEWIVRDQQAAQWFLHEIMPYTRCKKMQITIALQIIHTPIRTKKDLIRVARLADTLSSSNVRSKNRRKNFAAMIDES